MDEGLSQVLPQRVRARTALRSAALVAWPRDFIRVGLTLAVYGAATALLLERAPAILGNGWSWLALLLVPALTLLVAGLQTGTALALVLIYAFASATALAVQGYRLGWSETVQAQNIFSHFATVFFLASAVALIALLRSRQLALRQARGLVRRYVSEDEVSGLLTPAAFEAAASRELNRSHRTSRPFLLLSIDVSEYFKPGLGSATIEGAQRMLGSILSAETRGDYDLWTMWKADLYLGLLIETDEQAVYPALGRVLDRMAKAPEFNGAALVDKARFGLSSYPGDAAALETLLAAAVTNLRPFEDLLKDHEGTSSREQPGAKRVIEHVGNA